jgi:hypothetical protein
MGPLALHVKQALRLILTTARRARRAAAAREHVDPVDFLAAENVESRVCGVGCRNQPAVVKPPLSQIGGGFFWAHRL